MSQFGELIFYAKEKPLDARNAFHRILKVIQASDYYYAHRTMDADNSWARQSAGLPAVETVRIDSSVALYDLAAHFNDPQSLTISLKPCRISEDIYAAVGDTIPVSVRGDFIPYDPYITFGYHDLYEFSENPSGTYYGVAYVSVRLFGYSTPNDWNAFRMQVLDLAMVAKYEVLLRDILKSIDTCVIWQT